jgi:hypothetical protein
MESRNFLRLWELRYGKLSSDRQRDFLEHPDVAEILKFSPSSVVQFLRVHRDIEQLRSALEIEGRRKHQKAARAVAGETSIIRKPRTSAMNGSITAGRNLPKPIRQAGKTKAKQTGAERQSIREVAKKYRWWD